MVYILLCALSILSLAAFASENSVVDIQTNYGTITVELAADKAPLTVANFLTYTNEGFYEQTLFHRVIAGFMIQGGGFTTALVKKPTHAAIKLESNNGLSNLRGTIAMARTTVADSATSQFFINSVDNLFLNYENASNPGYAVFGKVTEGLNVVDAIAKVATSAAAATKDLPLKSVIIEAARVREAQLRFTGLKSTYQAGDLLNITLQENSINRKRVLDLWVALQLPNGELQFISPDNAGLFGRQPKPFKRDVSLSETQHPIATLTIPAGLTGQYQLYAIFNEAGRDASDLTHSLRSNLSNATLTLH